MALTTFTTDVVRNIQRHHHNTVISVCVTVQNALHPVWNEATDFDIVNPDLAMIRFCVQDEDVFGDPNFLGQATIPVRCLRSGEYYHTLINLSSDKCSSVRLKASKFYCNSHLSQLW